MDPTVSEIGIELIKELRARTGAGVMDCRAALREAGGDLERAVEILRARGVAVAARKAGRVAAEGLVEAYVHTGGRVGALVEVNCETDFVARTDDFRRLARDLAMQVTASAPLYVSREEVPADVVEAQRRQFAAELAGKPAAAVDGRLERWFQDVVLLEQPFIRDESRRVRDIITEAIARLGENIRVRRFARFRVGE
ncbi:MAG: translation elongation factor Ts [Armatimonadota bacterium]|nr:translation elongation factor Ts [Armatimonadota bacterium]MDR7402758.1 translation elongation factor Ts [Armatimonadota bacterium]MDR7405129.1 translation elongation factor Ts [Armatimonadota bacterium]MDR7437019.1 translation elongation factor Ts [Armatimonadota bacterium]MDR7472910.1 translation elongation factor Ts [Armatimonadota bacterium]